jgi:phosphomannomutase
MRIQSELKKDDIRWDYIESQIQKVDAQAIRERKFRVALDCANGAPSLIHSLSFE